MQLTGFVFERGTKKMLTCLIMLTLLFAVLGTFLPVTANAATGTPATSLTVKLNDNTVKTYSISELEGMTQVTQGYSSIDSMPAPCMTAARGVKVTDILTDAGIDVNSVQNIKFKSTDGYSISVAKQYLLDTPRYYYPNITTYWDSVNHCIYGDALAGGIQVDPILATKSYYKRFDTAPQFNMMDGVNTLRLCFGQDPNNITDATSGRFAKYVNEIDVDGNLLPATPPSVIADTTHNTVGQIVYLTFTDDIGWRSNISDITVNGNTIAGQYALSAGQIAVNAGVFTVAGTYQVVVKATGYRDANVSQIINSMVTNPVYTVIPVADAAYQNDTNVEGINTMTVKNGHSGMKYFGVQVVPATAHDGLEAVVFVHTRNGVQLSLNITKADFDLVDIAQAGFNVQPGDVVNAYIVDDITNDINFNPTILQAVD
ncbi:protein of unknown function DUF1533 [Desulfofarcimen acetoxidans DSM 771]|uniref:Heme-binding protein Shr-like Hb-interacting domain-containing protein n=1 Tax=Desulfofarcimen acetoxidans (strain ATCC 49208 / DSM 771 / KCTC 5769 / VKM B-1644 / 5575) TaxID=485916 RepID=C8W6T9_DESAS|nr:DUF1533 domain-containing protein [Desulfofarcimen acetoxidans]ACV64198.1 protein of unknown function DUF1533 [Desulfofarcimen acetoxidans DSM 771]